MATPETIRLLTNVRNSLASSSLTEDQAKLYSQRLRLQMRRPGLRSFTDATLRTALDDATLLLESALIERAAQPHEHWRHGIKRAAEVLEFIAHPDLRPPGAPLHLLAAAAYQVARFPAMALALLQRTPPTETVSEILRTFLSANFPAALESTRLFWRDRVMRPQERELSDFSLLAVDHTVMAIGTIASYFRTGDAAAVDRALAKLNHLATGFLHSRDSFSYLLARLTALAATEYVEAALWKHIVPLTVNANADTRAALRQFAHAAFQNRRAVVWRTQTAGIQRLEDNTSFVLTTPTGGGKTTVATLGILQALFATPVRPIGLEVFENNVVLYLVPSRALAAEVESRLSQDLRSISAQPVVVTGLYGGIDWGPTDAWIQTDAPTIAICTFEKADALLRYLGVLFLHRVRLVVADEAHMVEQDRNQLDGLMDGSSRPFRLELLGTRLREAQQNYNFRIIALSAVAGQAAPALSRWISGDPHATPTVSTHRSTRQMLGCLEVAANGHFTIRYALMDGRSLLFRDERRNQTPFVPAPFPPMPGIIDLRHPEKAMQAPTLWAALHLAAAQADGSTPSVLISVSQNIESFAAECADRLDDWADDDLPHYWDRTAATSLWASCLASASDYFTEESAEYRLLQRGVAVHHGKMPGLLARRLKVLIERGFVRVIIATSTLSEGVNIPVTHLLIPSLYRGANRLTVQEFTNLIGRVGRPGVSTEGHIFVVLPRPGMNSRQWRGYRDLLTALEAPTQTRARGDVDSATSPLAELLRAIEGSWRALTGGGTGQQFEDWLQQTAATTQTQAVDERRALEGLDSLDAFLLSAIQELEEIEEHDYAGPELEEALGRLWRCSYAFAAARDEERLRRIWMSRGRSVKTLYPERTVRRQIYRTSLTPRSALALVDRVDRIRQLFLDGANYATMATEQRLLCVGDVLAVLSDIPSFNIGTRLGRQPGFEDWRLVLRWWLAKNTLAQQPRPREVTHWYAFAARNFLYRGAWGLGSVLSLLLDLGEDEEPVRAMEMDDWPRSGLPWAAFWLKEIIAWGTLEPVAAFLLARANAREREGAEREAYGYYQQLPAGLEPNEMLDPRRIRLWVNERAGGEAPVAGVPDLDAPVDLAERPDAYADATLSVLQFEADGVISWITPAGYVVARSRRPREWPDSLEDYEFTLDVQRAMVRGLPYLPHARRAGT